MFVFFSKLLKFSLELSSSRSLSRLNPLRLEAIGIIFGEQKSTAMALFKRLFYFRLLWLWGLFVLLGAVAPSCGNILQSGSGGDGFPYPGAQIEVDSISSERRVALSLESDGSRKARVYGRGENGSLALLYEVIVTRSESGSSFVYVADGFQFIVERINSTQVANTSRFSMTLDGSLIEENMYNIGGTLVQDPFSFPQWPSFFNDGNAVPTDGSLDIQWDSATDPVDGIQSYTVVIGSSLGRERDNYVTTTSGDNDFDDGQVIVDETLSFNLGAETLSLTLNTNQLGNDLGVGLWHTALKVTNGKGIESDWLLGNSFLIYGLTPTHSSLCNGDGSSYDFGGAATALDGGVARYSYNGEIYCFVEDQNFSSGESIVSSTDFDRVVIQGDMNSTQPLHIEVDHLHVEAGGTISAPFINILSDESIIEGSLDSSARGYQGTVGVYYSYAGGPGVGTSRRHGGGGGAYGGTGGKAKWWSTAGWGGKSYGANVTGAPLFYGSAGGAATEQGVRRGGHGGGSIQVISATQLTVSGSITSNGEDGSNGYGGPQIDLATGGGAGGSVHLKSNRVTLESDAEVTANGGDGGRATGPWWSSDQVASGSGSGGRITVDSDDLDQDSAATVEALSGDKSLGLNQGSVEDGVVDTE